MQQSLSNLIMANSSFLKLNILFDEEKKDILRFYLDKDIFTFFGRNEFMIFGAPNDCDVLHFTGKNDRENPQILVEYAGEKYIFNGNKSGFTIRNEEQPNIRAYICYYSDTNSFVNDIYYQNDEKIIHERHRIYANENKGFEYKKSVKSEYGKVRYPICCMRLISKDDYDNEYYEIYSLNKEKDNIIKKFIDGIKEYSINGMDLSRDEYLESIFSIMEQNTESLKNPKKLTRVKNITNY